MQTPIETSPAATDTPPRPIVQRRWHTYLVCALVGIWGVWLLIFTIGLVSRTPNFFGSVGPVTGILAIASPMLMLFTSTALFFLERKAIIFSALTPLVMLATLIWMSPSTFDLSQEPLITSVVARLPDGSLLTLGVFIGVFLYSLRNRRRI